MDNTQEYYLSSPSYSKLSRKRREAIQKNAERRLEAAKQGEVIPGRWPKWMRELRDGPDEDEQIELRDCDCEACRLHLPPELGICPRSFWK